MTRRRAPWLAPLAIFLITAVAFLPTLSNGWVTWDDDKNFLENPHFRGLGAEQLAWMWSTFHLGHYVPLSWMSLGFDYELWGMVPAGYHATSLALHALSAAILFFIARRLIAAARDVDDASVTWGAVAAALFWAVHPLRVESVAWITERRDVLSGVFYFAAFLAYLRSRAGEHGHPRWYAASLLGFAAALLSKATAVTLPAVLVIVNVYPLRRLGGRAGWWSAAARQVYAELVPFAALAAGFGALTLVALQPVDQLDAAGKIAVSAFSWCFYLIKTILPLSLSPLYEMPLSISAAAPRYVASIAVAAVLAGVLAWRARRAPAPAAAGIAFFLVLLPLLGVHQNGPQIAADRYTYLASAAIAVLAGGALFATPRLSERAARLIAFAVVLTFSVITWRQVRVWHDGESLWTQVLRVEPHSALGNNNLGNLLMQRGDVDSALAHYTAAVDANPRYAEAHDNLGVVLARTGKPAEAVTHYRTALDLNPQLASAHGNWGAVLSGTGDVAGAIEHFRAALALDATYVDAHVNWGNALVRTGHAAEAVSHYRAAISLQPESVAAQLNWGIALAQQGDFAGAIGHFRAALAIDPAQADAQSYLAQATRDLEARAARR